MLQQFAYEAAGVVGVVFALWGLWQWFKASPRMVCPKCDGKGEFRSLGGFRDCKRCKRSGRVLRTSLRIASAFSTELKQRYADIPK